MNCENVSARGMQIVEAVKVYVQSHLAEDLSLARMAKIMDRSPSNLSKIFKQVTGTGYIDYVVAHRMERALLLLRSEPPVKLEDIAAQLGYSSCSYFIYVFHQCHGITPAEYRKTHQVSKS